MAAAAGIEIAERRLFEENGRRHFITQRFDRLLMDRGGTWSLSPAFDMTYAYNPQRKWTGRHQISLNGKRDGFSLDDFLRCAAGASMK